MNFENFWYCARLELARETGKPDYVRFFRETLKTFFPNRFSRTSAELPDVEFLFVVISENHWKHFRPVAELLALEKRSFSVVFANDALLEKYGGAWPGVSFSIQSFVTWRLYFKAVLFQARLFFAHLFSASNKKAVIIRFAKPVYLIQKAIAKLPPGLFKKAVLFKAEGYQANAFLTACQDRKTPTYAIQHGLIGDTEQVSNLAVGTYLVWSDFFKKRLERWHAGCRVMITGNAAYDGVFQTVAKSNTQALPETPLRILALPNTGVSHTPLIQVHLLMEAVLHFAKNNRDAIVTVKPHPADNTDNVKRFLLPHLAACPNLSLLDRFHCIPYSTHHLVAINNSGAGMEACIWQKPLLVFAPSWDDVMVKQYVEEGVAEFADSVKAFSEKATKIQAQYGGYKERCRKFTQNQLAFHGRAAHKIVEALT